MTFVKPEGFEAQRLDVLARHQRGETDQTIATLYGVTDKRIGQIRRGEVTTRPKQVPATRPCRECGALFTSVLPPHYQKYCSHACASRHHNLTQYHKQTLEEKRESNRRNDLKKLYDLTPEDYEKMLVAQNGVCWICWSPPPGSHRYLVVDHDHETGAIRGLLCSNCNTAIGMFRHDVHLLAKAIDYLATVKPREEP